MVLFKLLYISIFLFYPTLFYFFKRVKSYVFFFQQIPGQSHRPELNTKEHFRLKDILTPSAGE